MKITDNIITIFLMLVFGSTHATEIKINSLKELSEYAAKSGNEIIMSPGVYHLSDVLTADSLLARRNRGMFQFIIFNGNNNIFNLNGVEIVVDTELRTTLKPRNHTSEFLIKGTGNKLIGLVIKHIGEGTSPGGAALEVAGDNNTVKDVTIYVTGSYPYGYGDLFGKGGDSIIKHKKHSGLLVTGSNTKIISCELYMKSFGHGFYVQKNAENIYFEDCYVEGSMRKTDEILAETSGPAHDVGFRTWTVNRKGEYHVTPGYMKSLCEDGFRTYGQIKNIQFRNCTARNTRGGFELRTDGGIFLENCTVIGTERGYWVGNNAVLKNCKGDAAHGPLFYIEGKNVEAEITVSPAESDAQVHALGTIQESNNKLVLTSENDVARATDIPILVGYTPPLHGESMSPFEESETSDLLLINGTGMPLIIGEQATNCYIETDGEVIENKGTNIKISK